MRKEYPSHVNCVPYVNIDDARHYCQVTRLDFSKLDKDHNTFQPSYGIIMYQLSENAYNLIINPK